MSEPERPRAGDPAATDNRTRILHALRAEPGLSKIGLARRLRLGSSTISPLVVELASAGLLVAGEYEPSTGGRPAQRLHLNPERPRVVGIDLSGTAAHLGVLNLRGQLVETEKQPLRWTRGRVVLDQLLKAAHDLANRHKAVAVGVAVPGRIEHTAGTVLRASNLGWRDVPLRSRVEQQVGLPAIIDRNTNAALLAEEWWGTAPAGDPFVFVTAGSGIGAAVKVGGRLLRGTSDDAGQLGHILADSDGPECVCGRRGCLEALASAPAIVHRYQNLHRRAGSANSATRRRQSIGALVAASEHDAIATDVLTYASAQLGRGLISLISLFDPEVIVLGGELMAAEAMILPDIRDAVGRDGERFQRTVPWIECSTFGNQASLVGAATLAFDRLFASPVAGLTLSEELVTRDESSVQ